MISTRFATKVQTRSAQAEVQSAVRAAPAKFARAAAVFPGRSESPPFAEGAARFSRR